MFWIRIYSIGIRIRRLKENRFGISGLKYVYLHVLNLVKSAENSAIFAAADPVGVDPDPDLTVQKRNWILIRP